MSLFGDVQVETSRVFLLQRLRRQKQSEFSCSQALLKYFEFSTTKP